MKTRSGSMVALPYTLELGDIPIFLTHGGTGEDFYKIAVDQFDVLYEEGARTPRVLCMALHPFLIGHPYRARHLERALAYIKQHEGVWITTAARCWIAIWDRLRERELPKPHGDSEYRGIEWSNTQTAASAAAAQPSGRL